MLLEHVLLLGGLRQVLLPHHDHIRLDNFMLCIGIRLVLSACCTAAIEDHAPVVVFGGCTIITTLMLLLI